MNLTKLAFVLMSMWASQTFACLGVWEYDNHFEIDGYRFYQDGVAVGTAAPELRAALAEDIGVDCGRGVTTMTAFIGDHESLHSEPAILVIDAPGGLEFRVGPSDSSPAVIEALGGLAIRVESDSERGAEK